MSRCQFFHNPSRQRTGVGQRHETARKSQWYNERIEVTRNRINIDVDDRMDNWISLTAKVAGVSKTETARALLAHMQDNHHHRPGDRILESV